MHAYQIVLQRVRDTEKTEDPNVERGRKPRCFVLKVMVICDVTLHR